MCCSLEPAHFSATTIYVGEAKHPTRDVLTHVLGYQNTAENLSRGPNAMVLPFPSAEFMTPENVISNKDNAAALKQLFQRYRDTIRPVERGYSKSLAAGGCASNHVQVFDTGDYTVVMAKSDNIVEMHKALGQVRESRRPKLDRHFLVAYRKLYPGWTLALCCFDGSFQADPMLWWYVPLNTSRLFAPTLDAHDGKPPNVNQAVALDHTLVFGSTDRPRGERVFGQIDETLRPWLADRIHGVQYKPPVLSTQFELSDGWAANGDFVVKWDDVPAGRNPGWRPLRVPPPGAEVGK